MSMQISTTKRCLGLVSTLMIRPDGGRANIPAKTLATLWYLLVLPDAQVRLQRHLRHKRMPWYSIARLFGTALAAANIVTLPASWILLLAGRKNASRIAACGVMVNPPSIQLSWLLITELLTGCFKRGSNIVATVGAFVTAPFERKRTTGGADDQEEGEKQEKQEEQTA